MAVGQLGHQFTLQGAGDMVLTERTMAVLDKAAMAIAFMDRKAEINFYGVQTRFDEGAQEIADNLAKMVEEHSRGRYTVRLADPALFAHRFELHNLFLVRCDPETPREVVTELSAGMVLVSSGPFGGGFQINAEKATSQSAEEYRARAARQSRLKMAPQEGDQLARVLAFAMMESLQQRIDACTDRAIRDQLNDRIPIIRTRLRDQKDILSPIATACWLLGTDLTELLLEVVTARATATADACQAS